MPALTVKTSQSTSHVPTPSILPQPSQPQANDGTSPSSLQAATLSQGGSSSPQPSAPVPTATASTSQSPTPLPPSSSSAITVAPDSSPPRPPISPITPTLAPIQLPDPSGSATPLIQLPPRQVFTHSQQPNQVGIAPPPPVPITFDENPDALALKSAIAVLQIQRRKAAEDIRRLQRAKEAALGDPDAFGHDLAEGRVVASEGGLGIQASLLDDPLSSTSSSEDEGDGAGEPKVKKEKKKEAEPDGKKAWHSLPARQNVVRCPPVNWSQYAVVGESLDKLHADQVAAPTQGTPAAIGQGGVYEFKGGDGKKERLLGLAAPYTPGRDGLPEKKPKAPKR